MEFQQLRMFLKVAEQGSFTKAARDCGVSQPAISQQVGKLEATLGRPLFERQGRQVTLTEAGELLRRRALQIISLVDDTARLLRDDGETGRVVVSAIPTIAPYLMPGLLEAFHEDHPRARVEVNEEVTEVILRRCSQGEIDVGVLAMPASGGYLRFETLFEEEMLLVTPADHPLAGRDRVELDDLRDQPFVLLDEAHCLSDDIRSFCRRRQFQPVSTGRVSQLATVQELVAQGFGISLVPAMAVPVDPGPRLRFRPLDGDRPSRTITACWNPDRYQSRLMLRFLETLKRGRGGAS
ncbi:Hydrogen peroxide-inducible genes activator [Aquisphaera giovannonii]|uniref:Hydrogen peroxide-inducible genes activator n=1 Tax=Aquisphaera giovannonii TaxID=406548 RepID=A0A5B9WCI4_9BACT|nr:LysR family transcriptional regulator [Aquisphaera giovannonii]QEH37661.1 Hydrogen peroxide-inducible genes activator [Aquisphaera giovannonii]